MATVLQRRGLEIYLPEIEAPKASLKRKSEPFFPCYLFLKIDFDAVSLSQVQWTSGLRRVLTVGDRPVPISNEVIDFIRRKLGEIKANSGRSVHPFKAGDTVRITDGPFRDILAIFEGPTTPSERVQVLLIFLGHARRVQVEPTNLERVTIRTEAPAPKPRRRTRGRRSSQACRTPP